jgi:CRISPR system Cascade subunit CasE
LSRLLPSLRSRQARRDLAESYELHRSLLRAFPGPGAGGPGRVLYRVDADRESGAATILVQSEKEPDWSALTPDYLTQPAEWKRFDPVFAVGQRLVFRLRANPTRKSRTTSKADRLEGKHRCNGRRIALLREEDQVEWLHRKAHECGFRVRSVQAVPEGQALGHKSHQEQRQTLTHHAVRYDGLLEITDSARFLQTLLAGVGSAKGFGFGLLSLAPARG